MPLVLLKFFYARLRNNENSTTQIYSMTHQARLGTKLLITGFVQFAYAFSMVLWTFLCKKIIVGCELWGNALKFEVGRNVDHLKMGI